jgi:hypothetical protein
VLRAEDDRLRPAHVAVAQKVAQTKPQHLSILVPEVERPAPCLSEIAAAELDEI